MREAREIAHLFSRSTFVYLCRLTGPVWMARGGWGSTSAGFPLSEFGSPAFIKCHYQYFQKSWPG